MAGAPPGRKVQTSFAAFDLLNPEPFANSVYESVSNTEHLVRTSVFHNLGLDASGNVISNGGGIENRSSDASSTPPSPSMANAASPVAAAWAATAVAGGQGGDSASSGSPRSTAAAATTAGGPFSDMFATSAGEFDGDEEGESGASPPVPKQSPGIGGLD